MNRAAIAVALLLTTASAARAEDFLVPTAEYPTIQAAIDAASAAPGSNEVKVHLGTYVERLHIDSLAGDFLLISGGWEDGYTSTFGKSHLDGGGIGPVVKITGTDLGVVGLQGFNITGGDTPEDPAHSRGAALHVAIRGDSGVSFRRNRISGFHLGPPGNAAVVEAFVDGTSSLGFSENTLEDNQVARPSVFGGAFAATLRGRASLTMNKNVFLRNVVRATAAGSTAEAAGSHILALEDATVSMDRNSYRQNKASSGAAARNSALTLSVQAHASASLERNSFVDNSTESDTGDAIGVVALLASRSSFGGRAVVRAHRQTFRGNQVSDRKQPTVYLHANAGDVALTDSLIVRGNGDAIHAPSRAGGQIALTNLTVADNRGRSLRTGGDPTGGPVYLSNSLLYGNDADTVAAATQTANLVGTNPLFTNPTAGDYTLLAGSPAIDTGNASPPGGLGDHSLNGARVIGPAVDIGAYER